MPHAGVFLEPEVPLGTPWLGPPAPLAFPPRAPRQSAAGTGPVTSRWPARAPAPGPYRCDKCGKCYSYDTGLLRHKKQCDGLYNFVCGVCGKRFYRKDRLTSHQASTKHFPSQ